MISAYVCTGGHLVRLPDTASPDALRPAVWIDLISAGPAEVERTRQATGLRIPTQEEVSEIENSSRLAIHDGVLYLSLQLISMRNGGARGVSAGFVLSADRLISVRFAPSAIFDNFSARAAADKSGHDSAAHILIGLLEAIVDRQADALELVRNDMETLSHRIFDMGLGRSGGRKQEDATLRQTLGELDASAT